MLHLKTILPFFLTWPFDKMYFTFEIFCPPSFDGEQYNEAITPVIKKRDEGLHYPASYFSPPTLPFTFYLSTLYSTRVFTQSSGSEQQQTRRWQPSGKGTSRYLNCCWYPYLCGDSIQCVSSWPGQWIISTPVTSTSSSACNLSLKRWCCLCSLPGSLGDVWQCADRYDYP